MITTTNRMKIVIVFRLVTAVASALLTLLTTTVSAEPKRVKVLSLVQPMDNPWVVNNVKFKRQLLVRSAST